MRLVVPGRCRARVVPLLLSVAVLGSGLGGCRQGGRGPLETSKCQETQIETSAVDGAKPGDLQLRARLTTKDQGRPVSDRVVRFALRVPAKSGNAYETGGRTNANGEASVDLYAEAKRSGFANDNLKIANELFVSYQNPDAINDDKQPNYCSSDTTVTYRYTGPQAR